MDELEVRERQRRGSAVTSHLAALRADPHQRAANPHRRHHREFRAPPGRCSKALQPCLPGEVIGLSFEPPTTRRFEVQAKVLRSNKSQEGAWRSAVTFTLSDRDAVILINWIFINLEQK